ncbi:class I SAM-dependent methyltransferase [Pantanalinema sp. GBBB05]|uniref:class I SAM-dependent methyltransferase n=1 Tax=Pantanalinema sp. GBBB05 TaxID=2604139 RepID=UPI001D967208|nr:class I SAM-dependent methyltransferase [Pantanalinema sp. GBBB05]
MSNLSNKENINLVVSPITGSRNVKLEDELSSASIIKLYSHNYNLDVRDYFGNLKSIQIYRCLDTDFRFYFPYTLAGRSELYESLENYPSYYGLRLEHQLVKTYFRKGKKVLEVGCGSGFFLESLKKKGLECIGLELNEDAVRLATDKGLSVFAQDLIEHTQSNLGQYDIVCSFQVLEHIVDVSKFLRACVDCLKPGGKLIIVVPNNDPFYKLDKYHTLNLPPHHMGLWNKRSLENLEKFFPIKVDKVFVEPLQLPVYTSYLQLQIEKWKSQASFLSKLVEFLLLKIRPYRVRGYLQKIVFSALPNTPSLPGWNVIAIYTRQ